MKKILIYSLTLLLAACELFPKTEEPKTELEKLPPATQEGKYTFGCLLNGKAFVTKLTTDASGYYQKGVLQVAGTKNPPLEQIGLAIIENSEFVITRGTTYSLTDFPKSYCRVFIGFDDQTGCDYFPENIVSGSLTITKLDRVNFIVSGTFEFTAKADGCEDIVVTDGRFDIKYAP